MKNFKFKKILLPVLLVFVIIFLVYLKYLSDDYKIENFDNSNTINLDLSQVENNDDIGQQIKEETEIKQTDDFVTVNVLGENYQTDFVSGDTVFDIMNRIKAKKENAFDFKYKEYPSLGVFVNEINGIGSKDGKYWIYYVNGKEAEVGVSKYVLKESDIISWNQE